MSNLVPVDKLEIQVLVDNSTDGLSTTPPNVENEFAFATRRGLRASSGRCLCCAVHGFSALITATRGETRHAVLFDSGPEDFAFERNTARLGADLGSVESIVLSHGHWDHSGAMFTALGAIRARNGNRPVPYYAHPGMFRSRAMRLPNGGLRYMDDVPAIADLTAQGAEVICTAEPRAFLDGMFYVSGEIPRVTPFERGLPGQVCKTDDGKWEPDELLMDERWLAVNVKGKGLVVLSACSHAGIVNVLTHARASFADSRSTSRWAACICPAPTRRSSRRRSRRWATSISPRSPPAIAPAGARFPHWLPPLATRCWRPRRWGSGILFRVVPDGARPCGKLGKGHK